MYCRSIRYLSDEAEQAIVLENATLEDRFFASYAIHNFINTDDEALLKIANNDPGDHSKGEQLSLQTSAFSCYDRGTSILK
jgi:hypothetical protein